MLVVGLIHPLNFLHSTIVVIDESNELQIMYDVLSFHLKL